MSITDPKAIIEHLIPPDVKTIPFREYSSRRKELVDAAREVFEKGESRLEELSKTNGLDQERKYVFAKMEEHIRRLLLFDLAYDACIFAARYARIQQQYEKYEVH